MAKAGDRRNRNTTARGLPPAPGVSLIQVALGDRKEVDRADGTITGVGPRAQAKTRMRTWKVTAVFISRLHLPLQLRGVPPAWVLGIPCLQKQ